MTNGPAITSVSLFARATVLPAAKAAHVLRSPALPTIAATTTSTAASVANCSSASGPAIQRVSAGSSDQSASAAAVASATASVRGRRRWACSSKSWQFVEAAKATAFRAPPEAAMISTVLRPMLPVDPSTATFVGRLVMERGKPWFARRSAGLGAVRRLPKKRNAGSGNLVDR